jgi:hypothetical protein
VDRQANQRIRATATRTTARGSAMKTYWTVILTVWITGWVTFAATKVGQMSTASEFTSMLPFTFFFCNAFPALLGFLIGKEKT